MYLQELKKAYGEDAMQSCIRHLKSLCSSDASSILTVVDKSAGNYLDIQFLATNNIKTNLKEKGVDAKISTFLSDIAWLEYSREVMNAKEIFEQFGLEHLINSTVKSSLQLIGLKQTDCKTKKKSDTIRLMYIKQADFDKHKLSAAEIEKIFGAITGVKKESKRNKKKNADAGSSTNETFSHIVEELEEKFDNEVGAISIDNTYDSDAKADGSDDENLTIEEPIVLKGLDPNCDIEEIIENKNAYQYFGACKFFYGTGVRAFVFLLSKTADGKDTVLFLQDCIIVPNNFDPQQEKLSSHVMVDIMSELGNDPNKMTMFVIPEQNMTSYMMLQNNTTNEKVKKNQLTKMYIHTAHHIPSQDFRDALVSYSIKSSKTIQLSQFIYHDAKFAVLDSLPEDAIQQQMMRQTYVSPEYDLIIKKRIERNLNAIPLLVYMYNKFSFRTNMYFNGLCVITQKMLRAVKIPIVLQMIGHYYKLLNSPVNVETEIKACIDAVAEERNNRKGQHLVDKFSEYNKPEAQKRESSSSIERAVPAKKKYVSELMKCLPETYALLQKEQLVDFLPFKRTPDVTGIEGSECQTIADCEYIYKPCKLSDNSHSSLLSAVGKYLHGNECNFVASIFKIVSDNNAYLKEKHLTSSCLDVCLGLLTQQKDTLNIIIAILVNKFKITINIYNDVNKKWRVCRPVQDSDEAIYLLFNGVTYTAVKCVTTNKDSARCTVCTDIINTETANAIEPIIGILSDDEDDDATLY